MLATRFADRPLRCRYACNASRLFLAALLFALLGMARTAQAQAPDLTKFRPIQINFNSNHTYEANLYVDAQNASGDFTGTLVYNGIVYGVSGNITYDATFNGTHLVFTAQKPTKTSLTTLQFDGAANVEGAPLFVAGTCYQTVQSHIGWYYLTYKRWMPFCGKGYQSLPPN